MPPPAPSPVFILRGSKEAVSCLDFSSHQGKGLLISGCTAGEIRVWNLKSRRTVQTLDGHGGKGILTAIARRDGSIISHARDGRLNIWTIDEGRKDNTTTLSIPCQSFCKCDLLEEEQLLACTGSQRSEVSVYDLRSQKLVKNLLPPTQHQHLGMPMGLKFLSQERLGVGYEDGCIAIWDLIAQKIISEKKFFKEPVMCFDYSSNLMKGVCGSVGDRVLSWSLNKDFTVEVGSEVKLTNPGISGVTIRGDGRIGATGGWDSRLRIFGMKKLTPLAVLSYHTDSVHCVQFSSCLTDFDDEYLLAAGSKDKHISVWSIYNG